jgi:serine protease AprX
MLCKNKLITFKDFVNKKEKNYDDNGHGTFVTSVACGSGVLSNFKYSGIACGSNIISLKALDEKGEANAGSTAPGVT